VHYSTATVKNCVFRENFEGMRFSTTDVIIEHNDFLNNSFGIRYESHGSRSTVAKNRFSGNGQTFFPVQKCGDTVRISDNNIEGSKDYAVNLGTNQKQDLDYTGNWWGTANPDEIEAAIFDKTKDETLGRVKFTPFLKAPASDCGIL
jgi:parallel beta-helix repeat protein